MLLLWNHVYFNTIRFNIDTQDPSTLFTETQEWLEESDSEDEDEEAKGGEEEEDEDSEEESDDEEGKTCDFHLQSVIAISIWNIKLRGTLRELKSNDVELIFPAKSYLTL